MAIEIPKLSPNPNKLQKLQALKKLLENVKDDQPNAFDYSVGLSRTSGDRSRDYPIEEIQQFMTDNNIHLCGTPGCVAGWCAVLNSEAKDDYTTWWGDISTLSSQFLELTYRERGFLFMADEDFGFPNLFLEDATIDDALERLSHIIYRVEHNLPEE